VYQNPIPLYFHNSINGGGNGCGIILWKELFSKYESEFFNISNPREVVPARFDATLEKFEMALKAASEGQSSDVDFEVRRPNQEFAPHHKVITHLPPIRQNVQSTIKRSEMHGVFPITRVPARLRVYLDEGEEKPIMPKSRETYGSNDACVNLAVMDAAGEATAREIINCSTPIIDNKVLTYEQSVLGDTGLNLPALDRNTSCGFTLNLIKQKLGFTGKGKYWLFGDGKLIDLDRWQAKVLRELVMEMIKILESGDRMYAPYLDCLKDELREFEKVKNGSTRLFCACELVYLIICKMYFGSFASWIYENRIRNGIAIGINPFSDEWTALYKKMRRKGNRGVFGDFSKYDKKLLACLIYYTLYLAHLFYGTEDKAATMVRTMLFEDMINSLHAIPDGDATAIYEWLHGNTSGNFLTAIINSVANLVLCLYVFIAIVLAEEGKDIMLAKPIECPIEMCQRETDVTAYGDDNAIVVSDNIDCIDFYSIQREIRRVGLDYTDELKGKNGEVAKWREVKDGNFIARGFIETSFFGYFRMMAGLRLHSILEAPQWYKGLVDSDNIVLIVERCLVELAIRGEEDHAKYGQVLAQRCYKEYKVWPKYTNWELTMMALEKIPPPLYTSMNPPKELGEEFLNFLAAEYDTATGKSSVSGHSLAPNA
jgi:hypothetical protein